MEALELSLQSRTEEGTLVNPGNHGESFPISTPTQLYGDFVAGGIPFNRPRVAKHTKISMWYVNNGLVQHVLVSTAESIHQPVIKSVLIQMPQHSLINQTQRAAYVSLSVRICAVLQDSLRNDRLYFQGSFPEKHWSDPHDSDHCSNSFCKSA